MHLDEIWQGGAGVFLQKRQVGMESPLDVDRRVVVQSLHRLHRELGCT
jgi:hypothetical protein